MQMMLIRPKLSTWEKVRIHLSREYEQLDLDHQLYVPDYFILGNFKERDGRFVLSSNGIFYTEDRGALRKYFDNLTKGKLESLNNVEVSKETLERIPILGKTYLESQRNILDALRTIPRFQMS